MESLDENGSKCDIFVSYMYIMRKVPSSEVKGQNNMQLLVHKDNK